MTAPPTRRGPRRVAWVLAAVAVLATAAGCGDDGDDGAASPTTGPGATVDLMDLCGMFMPGDVRGAADAIVRFADDEVCPAYVTVATGTPVTWANLSSEPQTVTLTDAAIPGATDPLHDTTPTTTAVAVDEFTIDPGDTHARAFDEPGVFTFTLSGLEAFTGTVEVVVAGT